VPVRLLIDGYNLLKRSSMAMLFGGSDLESARAYLLARLFDYRREKRVNISIVFDAPDGLSLTRTKENHKGVEVVYSKQGESADQVIIEAIRRRPAGLVVVTSDRVILDEAKRHQVAFITPDRLEASLNGEAEEDQGSRVDKKGNPRKAPKNVRKARRAIRKV
jgi:uncharacterized protein